METSHFPHSALWGSERSRYQYSQWIADSSSRTIKLLPVPPPSLPSWHWAREIATAARNEKSRGRRLIWDRQFLLYFVAFVLLSSDPFLPKKKTTKVSTHLQLKSLQPAPSSHPQLHSGGRISTFLTAMGDVKLEILASTLGQRPSFFFWSTQKAPRTKRLMFWKFSQVN